MATTLNLETTYAGQVAGEYIQAVFLAADTLNNITVKTNVPGTLVVRKITDNATGFGGETCTFSDGGTVDISQKEINLATLTLQRKLCKSSFYHDWEALAAQNGDITKVSDALIATMGGVISQILETKVWQGVAGTGSFDGFETLFLADTTVLDVATPVAITESNVLDEIKKTISTLPIRVRRAVEKPKLYIASNVAEAYRNAVLALGTGGYLYQGEAVKMTWNGQYEIVECAGMTDNRMVFTQASNLWFGTNVMSDLNNIQVVDMSVFAEDNVRFAFKGFGAVNYGFGDEIAFYHPA